MEAVVRDGIPRGIGGLHLFHEQWVSGRLAVGRREVRFAEVSQFTDERALDEGTLALGGSVADGIADSVNDGASQLIAGLLAGVLRGKHTSNSTSAWRNRRSLVAPHAIHVNQSQTFYLQFNDPLVDLVDPQDPVVVRVGHEHVVPGCGQPHRFG